ncbi:MAG: hypothetical protein ACOCUH_03060 [Bacteriovoracia bacterium]
MNVSKVENFSRTRLLIHKIAWKENLDWDRAWALIDEQIISLSEENKYLANNDLIWGAIWNDPSQYAQAKWWIGREVIGYFDEWEIDKLEVVDLPPCKGMLWSLNKAHLSWNSIEKWLAKNLDNFPSSEGFLRIRTSLTEDQDILYGQSQLEYIKLNDICSLSGKN